MHELLPVFGLVFMFVNAVCGAKHWQRGNIGWAAAYGAGFVCSAMSAARLYQ